MKKKYINYKLSLDFTTKGSGPTVLDGLPDTAYSRARSRYCPTRRLLPAAFPPWAGSSLLRRCNLDGKDGSPPPPILMPGLARTPGRHRNQRPAGAPASSRPQIPASESLGLQEHATTPGHWTLRRTPSLSSLVSPRSIDYRVLLIWCVLQSWKDRRVHGGTRPLVWKLRKFQFCALKCVVTGTFPLARWRHYLFKSNHPAHV